MNATRPKALRAVHWTLLSSLGFATMGALIKYVNRLPAWEVVFFRSFVNFLWLLPWAIRNPDKSWRREWSTLLLRGVFGCLAMFLYFYAIETIKLADAAMLNYSSPILVLVLSALILKERLSALSVVFVLVAFVGVGLILKPGGNWNGLAGVAGLASALASAIAYVAVKHATRSIRPQFIVFTFALVASALSLPPALVHYLAPTPLEWAILIALGTFATYAQMAMTRGYAGLPASVAAPLSLVTVLLMGLYGWAFWSEVPDGWSVLGAVLIAVGLIGAYRARPGARAQAVA